MFVAGSYVAFYRQQFLGQIQEGFAIEWSVDGEPVGTDYWGQMVQDVVFLCGNIYVSLTCLEPDLNVVQEMMWPQPPSQQPGQQTIPFGTWMQPGVLWRHLGQSPLHLISRAGTNATPNQIVFPYVIVQPGYTIRTNWASTLRRIPIRLLALPVPIPSEEPVALKYPFGGIGMIAFYQGNRATPTPTMQPPAIPPLPQ
jgi:hypothetical protein